MDAMMQHLSQNPQLMAQFMQVTLLNCLLSLAVFHLQIPIYQQLMQHMVTNPETFEVHTTCNFTHKMCMLVLTTGSG